MKTMTKVWMGLIGGVCITGLFYYLSLPDDEKEKIKEKVKSMKRKECDMLDEA